MNGATALTSCTSSSSTDGTSCEQQAPRVAAAQVDLLQILIEPALGKQVLLRRSSSGSSGTCDSCGGVGQAGHVGERRVERRAAGRGPPSGSR